jgi:putative transposase
LETLKKARFTETQIISILKEHDSGRSDAELCREHGISQPTFTAGRANMEASMLPSSSGSRRWKRRTPD